MAAARAKAERERIVGRAGELTALHAAAGEARTRAGVVLVRAAAGVGKTTLLRAFVDELAGATVVETRGVESEALVDWALLDRLLRATGPAVDVLAGAVGQVDAGLLLLERLGQLQEGRPAVVVIDDAHWGDAPSLRALGFALRRLTSERVLVVLAARDDDSAPAEAVAELLADSGAVVDVAPLDARELVELAARFELSLTPLEAARLRELTGGIPLHARALLEEVPPQRWLDADLPATPPRSLATVVRQRLERLTPSARAVVDGLAVIGRPADLATIATVAGVTPSEADLDAGTATRLLLQRSAPAGAELAFAHPLQAAAAYEAIALGRRAELHLRAATVSSDRLTQLRHRAAGVVGADAELAAELAGFAGEEAARGALPSAASALLSASAVSGDGPARERLRMRAIQLLISAGMTRRARQLAEAVEAQPPTATGLSVQVLSAVAGRDHERAGTLLATAWAAVEAERDAPLAATIAFLTATHALLDLDPLRALAWWERGEAFSDRRDETRGLHAWALTLAGRLDDARAELALLPERTTLAQRGEIDLFAGDLDRARRRLADGAAQAVEAGRLGDAAGVLAVLTHAEYLAGAWDEAVVSAARAAAFAEELAHELMPFVCWPLVAVCAGRGDWEQAERYLRAAEAHAADCADHVAHLALARAVLAAERGRPAGVVEALQPLLAIQPREAIDEPGLWPWPELLANALAELGRPEEADAVLTPHEATAAARGRPTAIGRLARVRARLAAAGGDAEAAEAAFARALAATAALPYEQALTQLALGAHLRRRKRRREAAVQLTAARDRLRQLGARPALERCERELEACGLAPARRDGSAARELTPQERTIALLAVDGRSNREIAAELMLSVRTIEHHLRNAYGKLGVRSRVELIAAVHERGALI